MRSWVWIREPNFLPYYYLKKKKEIFIRCKYFCLRSFSLVALYLLCRMFMFFFFLKRHIRILAHTRWRHRYIKLVNALIYWIVNFMFVHISIVTCSYFIKKIDSPFQNYQAFGSSLMIYVNQSIWIWCKFTERKFHSFAIIASIRRAFAFILKKKYIYE